MGKLINITSLIKREGPSDPEGKGYRLFHLLDEETQLAISFFFVASFIEQCRMGLGLDDDETYMDDVGLPLFSMIDDIYQEAAGGCYFCDSRIDPNATEFHRKTYVCIKCLLKLANYTQFIGIDPESIFNLVVVPRRVQKARL